MALPGTRAVTFEALLRWRHPRRGLLSPSVFIPIAERSELIFALDEWVIKAVCRDLHRQSAAVAGATFRININLSARHFERTDLVRYIAAMLSRADVSGRHLGVEITESVLLAEPRRAAQTLQELKRLGVTVAIDDFGVGYSSLSYLSQLPVDVVKVDRSFIGRIGQGERSISRYTYELNAC